MVYLDGGHQGRVLLTSQIIGNKFPLIPLYPNTNSCANPAAVCVFWRLVKK